MRSLAKRQGHGAVCCRARERELWEGKVPTISLACLPRGELAFLPAALLSKKVILEPGHWPAQLEY